MKNVLDIYKGSQSLEGCNFSAAVVIFDKIVSSSEDYLDTIDNIALINIVLDENVNVFTRDEIRVALVKVGSILKRHCCHSKFRPLSLVEMKFAGLNLIDNLKKEHFNPSASAGINVKLKAYFDSEEFAKSKKGLVK